MNRTLRLALAIIVLGTGAAAQGTAPTWPLTLSGNGHTLVVHPPQVDEWIEFRTLKFRAAFELIPEGQTTGQVGGLDVEATTRVDLETRLVAIPTLTITKIVLPGADASQTARLEEVVRGLFPKERAAVGLDRILAALERTRVDLSEAQILDEPPQILVSMEPAVLVIFDGEPILQPVPSSALLYAINTNWDLLFDVASARYFLRIADAWISAASLDGPWSPAGQLPQEFWKLPDHANWKDVRAQLPGRPIDAADIPKVFVTHMPAELIVIDGTPKFRPLSPTPLLQIVNTESTVLLDGADGQYYYLVAGRWFRTAGPDQPWEPVGAGLPPEFAQIPPGVLADEVMASIPGTRQAEEAVLVAQIPQLAEVNVAEAAKTFTVQYHDEPRFAPIPETSLEVAVNTAQDVIFCNGAYYACHQGVWFQSETATGPWQVCTDVPADIYAMPPSSPVYHTTYVVCYDDDAADGLVTFGYLAGYLGAYVLHGALVWGTGWYYPPYAWQGIYYPRPITYGVAARYNPYTGTFARGAVAYGPYGGYGRAAAYDARTGTYARGAAAWGPEGGVWGMEAYNPRTGAGAATIQTRTPYGSWGSTVVSSGDEWARAAHRSTGERTVAGARTSEGGAVVARSGPQGSSAVGRTGSGDLYYANDGTVWRKTDDGLQRYEGRGDWNTLEKPASPGERPVTTLPVSRDVQAREEGARRAREASQFRTETRAQQYSPAARPATEGLGSRRPTGGQSGFQRPAPSGGGGLGGRGGGAGGGRGGGGRRR